MPHMTMRSKNEYLQELISQHGGYHLKTKKEKTILLNEYCANTSQNRDYVIRKISKGTVWKDKTPRTRKRQYDGAVVATLACIYDIFDYPCGQRLAPLLKTEASKLKELGEISCSDKVIAKLTQISPRHIDNLLVHHKEEARLKRKYQPKSHPLLYQKVPVKVFAEQDRTMFGLIQIDQVEHCGSSVAGEYVNTLSTTDIAHGWWEGAAGMGKSQYSAKACLESARSRYPLEWREMHADNGTPLLNDLVARYCTGNGITFSRSRPYKKNDNCLVEQKNWTHVRRKLGYLRYDTSEECAVINDLYAHELRLFKNFFQPVMKLKEKERVGGRLKRKYDESRTPYQRMMDDPDIVSSVKQGLQTIYEGLNPAQLKRDMDKKLTLLYYAYQKKQGKPNDEKVKSAKKLIPSSLTFSIAEEEGIHRPMLIA